ncbi:hypothetical protein [Chryseobacterium cheonjiense]|uniref:Lipoprotein n=1 Tax=Chryseobacterium cheonjiense TaxID=2728845 RepID=A0A7Y0FKA0_9FLAO|nr:hypothetical protein [Chryseobacterium cheonjiense]NML59408.1 hypothetical protein [Chryseobacterium cheonjiense]
MKKLLIFTNILLVLFSCQAQHTENDILSKNKKLYNKLYQTNGNIFAIGTSNFESSYMWSYAKENITVYNLVRGKISSKKIIYLQNHDQKWLHTPAKDDFGLDQCIATDGFVLLYKVKNDISFIERRFPITLDCMKSGTYESDFFKNLVNDINSYNIGWKNIVIN